MKREIRKVALQTRNALTKEQQLEYSQRIVEQLKPYLKGNIAIYQSFGSEVSLQSLELDTYYLPVVKEHYQMDFVACHQQTVFQKNSYGIDEPTSQQIVNPSALDVMVIPMVAFDKDNQRLGYGKGYYDRYLKQTSCLKIGVAFSCQKVDTVYADANDVRLDLIITENRIYK